jgi:hypothetical protein
MLYPYPTLPSAIPGRARQRGVTPSTTSDAIFSNTTVYISHVTSCGVTQLLVTHGTWRDQKAPCWNFSSEGVIFKILY